MIQTLFEINSSTCFKFLPIGADVLRACVLSCCHAFNSSKALCEECVVYDCWITG